MSPILLKLHEAMRGGISVCYVVILKTNGSMPRKAGTAMLVYSDGTQFGAIGGGEAESEAKRRAVVALQSGDREIATIPFQCETSADVRGILILLEPVIPDNGSYAITQILIEAAIAGTGFTDVVIVDPNAATGGNVANRWLIDDNGKVLAQRGDHPTDPPTKVLVGLRPLSERRRPYFESGVAYLPSTRRYRLIIIGGGHLGQKVASLATDVEFEVCVVEDRVEYCDPDRFPSSVTIVQSNPGIDLKTLSIDETTFIVIVTRDQAHDRQALLQLVTSKAVYIGMIGNLTKIQTIFDDLIQQGIPRSDLQRVHAPVGIDIGSQTVAEIAISIVAELIAHRNLETVPDALRRPSLAD